jgi:hypothetical protein
MQNLIEMLNPPCCCDAAGKKALAGEVLAGSPHSGTVRWIRTHTLCRQNCEGASIKNCQGRPLEMSTSFCCQISYYAFIKYSCHMNCDHPLEMNTSLE